MKTEKKISSPWPFALPADGWYHLAPRGEFLGVDDLTGKEVTQVLDDVAFDAIVADFNRKAAAENFSGLLIDYDHFSKDPNKASVAAGWITELQVRDDGLWFRCRWSETGESNLRSGCYRFISPVFGGGYIAENKARPLELRRAGLTNDPNFKTLRPLSNRAKGEQEPQQKDPTMKKLLAFLGLSPDASEDSAIEAVTPLKTAFTDLATMTNRATAAETKLKELKDAQLKTDADTFCKEHEALIENRDAVHAQYLKDPDGTQAIFSGMKTAPAGEKHTTMYNRAKKTPGQNAVKSNADLLEGKVQEYRSTNRCSYQQAFDAMSRAHPELLETETRDDD